MSLDENVVEAASGRPRALVVTAEPDRGEGFERGLAAAGLDPVIVGDARGADQLVSGALPDVLILDRGMPGLALFRLYSALRSRPGGAELPIYFVGEPGTDTPTDHYLPREASPDEIVDRVRAGLGRSVDAIERASPAPVAEGDSPPVMMPIASDAVDAPATVVEAPLPRDGEDTVAATPVTPGDEPATAPLAAPLAEPMITPTDAAPAGQPVAAETLRPAVGPASQPIEPVGPMPLIVGAVGPPPSADPPGAEPERTVLETTPVTTEEPRPSRFARLDVWLLRLGLVLLLIGGAVLLLRPDTATQPIAPPNLPTATPAATRPPTSSPSPAAVAPDAPAGRR